MLCKITECRSVQGVWWLSVHFHFRAIDRVSSNLNFKLLIMTRTEFLLHYQYSIKHTSVKNREENSIRELQVDTVPNSPNWYHKYFMAGSKDEILGVRGLKLFMSTGTTLCSDWVMVTSINMLFGVQIIPGHLVLAFNACSIRQA